MTQPTNPLALIATAPLQSRNDGKATSWYQAMAEAWGQTLDKQAGTLESIAEQISTEGDDRPSTLTLMSAESLKFGYLSNASHTSLTSVGEALKTTAQKT
jgi:hypothetical protein